MLGALLLLLGCKFFLIANFATSAPFWDQWEGEANKLFLPYMRGELGWQQLLAAHNEHRILTARLLFLVLLELGGGWNPLLELMVSGLLHITVIATVLFLLRRALDPTAMGSLALALVAIFIPPVAYENLLWSFQPCFYLYLLAGIVAIALLGDAPLLTARWWTGVAMSLVAYLSIASGTVVPFVAALVIALQALAGARARDWRMWTSLGLLLGLTGLFFIFVPHPARPGSLGDILRAFTLIGGWPLRLSLLSPVILQAPTILLVVRTLRRRSPVDDPAWRLVGLNLFAVATLALAAVSRTAAPLAPRYFDFCTISLFLNLVTLFFLARQVTQMRRITLGMMAIWIGLALAFLFLWAARHSRDAIVAFSAARHHDIGMIAEVVRTGHARPIPFSIPERPLQMLALPEIRGLLPAEYGALESERTAARARLRLHGGLRLTTDRLLTISRLVGAGGLAFGVSLLAMMGFLSSRRTTP